MRSSLAAFVVALLVASQSLSGQDTSAALPVRAGILVDFQDVDLRAVVTALAEAGNLNVSYGDIPSRRVTLRLRQPISREDVLPLLRSFAQSNGLQVVQEERFIRLEADATRGLPPCSR